MKNVMSTIYATQSNKYIYLLYGKKLLLVPPESWYKLAAPINRQILSQINNLMYNKIFEEV